MYVIPSTNSSGYLGVFLSPIMMSELLTLRVQLASELIPLKSYLFIDVITVADE